MAEMTPDELADRLAKIDQRLDKGSGRMDDIERELRENTAATLEGNRDAREILEIFQAVKGGIRVLGWIGIAVRWVAGFGGAAMAIYGVWYAYTHNGQLPPKP